MTRGSLPAEYFRRLYADSDDPWRIAAGFYEERKRAMTVAALTQQRFGTVFEPACGNGDLTVLLAPRADRVMAWDVAQAAATRAGERTADLPQVSVDLGGVPAHWPAGPADLVVLSEVGYYLAEPDLTRTLDAATASLGTNGTLLAVHWRRHAPDYPLTGDEVHRVIAARPELTRLASYRDDDFLLEVFTTGEAVSVARATGVV